MNKDSLSPIEQASSYSVICHAAFVISILLHWSLPVPAALPHCLNYYSFITNTTSGRIRLPPSPHSPLCCCAVQLFGQSWDFTLHKNFKISLVIPTHTHTKICWILIEFAFEIIDYFRKNWHLYSILSFHENNLSVSYSSSLKIPLNFFYKSLVYLLLDFFLTALQLLLSMLMACFFLLYFSVIILKYGNDTYFCMFIFFYPETLLNSLLSYCLSVDSLGFST